jgi:phosphoglycolate phosphatase-like HAD superfamily hydrolase
MVQAEDSTGYSSTTIEVANRCFPRGDFRAAIFDFDGTLSLLRRNWQDIMIPMMVDVLSATGTAESRAELHQVVEDYVMRLNGRQTIYQMIRLAEEVAKRGGTPREPLDYKHQYHDLLWAEVGVRVDNVRNGSVEPEVMTVPGSRALLQRLQRAGLALYLASGTDLKYVRDEVGLLGLADYFGHNIYGALDDYRRFSKAMIIHQMIQDTGLPGRHIVAFGDGFVEIEETKKVGGLAIGVASNETTREGINAWKRKRLLAAGADIIVGDYRCLDTLMEMIGIP